MNNIAPTIEIIEYHKNKSTEIFNNNIKDRITNFIDEDIEESFNISEDTFEDTWTFALVMGLCGKHYFGTDIAVAYTRADGNNTASITIVNKVKRYNRLRGELFGYEEKIKNMQEGSSKYEKVIAKIEKIKADLEKYKPTCVIE